MKKIKIGFSFLLAFSLILTSCNQQKLDRANQNNVVQQENKDVLNANDRTFIHTASMEMEANNCLETTKRIEQQVLASHGFILNSTITKDKDKEIESEISADSINKTTYYHTTSSLVVRVPDSSLQGFLQYVQSISGMIHKRMIDATDISFAILSDTLSGNLAKIQKRKLLDDAAFSTITLKITQPTEVAYSTIVNAHNTWAKESTIGNRAWFSVQKGFYQLMRFCIALVQFWWLVPIFILSKILYRKYKSKFLIYNSPKKN